MSKFELRSPFKYTSANYERCLSHWKYSKQSPKRIAIIGAGMAGLTCAWLLKKAGHTVRIFEAGNVVGGRVKTLRDGFSPGLYAEAGAMRIPNDHTVTMWLVKHFGLKTWKFVNESEHTKIYVNDQFAKRGGYENPKTTTTFGFSLSAKERKKTAQKMLEECIVNLIKRKCPEEKKIDFATLRELASKDIQRLESIRKELDKYSLRQLFSEELAAGGLSQGAVDLMNLIEGLETHLSASVTAVLDDHLVLSGNKFHQVRDGMDNLPKAFLEKITKFGENIRYNSRVIELEQAKRGLGDNASNKIFVRVENTITGRDNAEDRRRDGKWFDLVVIAIPFSALRRMRMRQLGTSAGKRRAIRQLHYDNACKILLEFSKPFWKKQNIDGGSSITDLPIRRICYPIDEQRKPPRCVLLASYTWGDDSLRWTSLKQNHRIRFALRDVGLVHPETADLESLCIGGMSHSWAEDEFTSGAFALFEPFQLSTLFDDVWSPDGLLHYCGEHTSLKHGWIEGAVESGIRAADEVCGRIAADPSLTEPVPKVIG